MLENLPRSRKQAVYLTFDAMMVPIAFFLAYCLRFSTLTPFDYVKDALPLLIALSLAAPLVILVAGLPKIKLSALDMRGTARVGITAAALGTVAIVLSYIMGVWTPRSIPIILGIVFFVLSVLGRMTGLFLLNKPWEAADGIPVAIHGAGAAGIQLASALRQSPEFRPVIFTDDNPNLHGLIISDLRVAPRERLKQLAAQGEIKQVLLAIPSLSETERENMLRSFEELPLEVRVLPSYVELIEKSNTELRTVSPDELLSRDKVDLDIPETAKAYAGRVVFITGAGGSIGSELARQVLNCRPAHIVLFEQSEFAMYEIDREMRMKAGELGIEVTSRLGSVTDQRRVTDVMAETGVEIVLHAAAYKHVPIVEENEVEGVRNNVLGTQVVALAARAANVERFILVSTDKAVRPANVMGATKRMAEMVVQDIQTRTERTRFSMVRFGNVLGSSGSVLPLFQAQIRAGGPVTVTHPEVTRYFMTIPEAARLVLVAGAFAEGGDVFVLDMGKPVKIVDIAHRMIKMAGAKIKSPEHPKGLEIEIVGLRKGEKLYEELLIDRKNLVETPHEKILRASETKLSEIEVASMLREINAAVENNDAKALRNALLTFVEGYHKVSDISETKPEVIA